MTATKTNERPGTRAVLRHSGLSASKARQVLDLIRGQDVDRAAEILIGTERGAADVIGKVLNSAVSNAAHNDQQNPDELYVSACYADEGTTAKRWRPRARGRATRIRKRTSHITIIVSRLPEAKLELRRKRMEAVSAPSLPPGQMLPAPPGRPLGRRPGRAAGPARRRRGRGRGRRQPRVTRTSPMTCAPETTDVTNPEIETEEDFAAEGGTEAIVVDEANSEDDTAEAPADADEKGE